MEEKKGFIDKAVDSVFSLDKNLFYLFILTIAGFVFRVINANNRTVFGDPPHFVLHAKNFLNSGLLVVWDQSTFLWYALTDIFYKVFGITQFASRFPSVLFGTLTILLVYMFVNEFFGNKRMALISAAIYALAPTFILNSADEHDISVLFFIMFSFYYLVKGLNEKSNKKILLSSLVFGLAAMWKAYLAILLVPYIGFIIYRWKTRTLLKKNFKLLLYIMVIIIVMVSPYLIYEYLNQKHNQVPTFIFATTFPSDNQKVTDLYGWTAGGEIHRKSTYFQRVFISHAYGKPNQDSVPSELYIGITQSLYSNGRILWWIIIVGFLLMVRKRKSDQKVKDYIVFYLLYLIIPFFVLIDGNFLNKHYIQFVAFGIPFVAYLFDNTYFYLKNKFSFINKFVENKSYLSILFIFVMLFEYFVVLSLPFNNEFFFSKNSESQLLGYKEENIPEKSLIIYDERIYNSLAGWLFNDRYYVSVANLNQFLDINSQSNSKERIPVYIVECVPDNQCGWAVPPELNESMENFFTSIKNQSVSAVHVSKAKLFANTDNISYYNPLISKKRESDQFIVYLAYMDIDLDLAHQLKMQYAYFLYPIGYENKQHPIFQNFIYQPEGFFEVAINKFAWFVFYIEIFLSFMTIPLLFRELYTS